MGLIDTVILILVVMSVALGMLVTLLATKLIQLPSQKNNKLIYSLLMISLLALVITLFSKALMTSSNGNTDECKKADPPFWCYLDENQ